MAETFDSVSTERYALRAEIAAKDARIARLENINSLLRKKAMDLAMGRLRFEHKGDEEWITQQIDADIAAAKVE